MKKLIKVFILVICVYFLWTTNAQAQTTQKEDYQIKGTFNGVRSGMIRLMSEDGRKVEDSAIITDGKFLLKGKTGLPEQRVFQITPGIWSFPAFVEPGNLAFNIDTSGAQHFGEIGKGGHALIWQIEEKGSEMADAYYSYLKESNMMKSRALVFSLKDSIRKIQDNPDAKRQINSVIDSVINNTLFKQKMFMEGYVEAHPSSVAGAFLLTNYYKTSDLAHKSPRDYLTAMLPKFSGQAIQSIYYKRLVEKRDALNKSSVNKTAPDFTLLKRDSTNFTLSSLRGNYVLLDFWASWCGPCRAAIPHWKEINTRYDAKGLKIVSVANNRSWNTWIEALDKEQMPWIQVVDDFSSKEQSGARVVNLFSSPSLPFYVLIDKAGKIVMSTGDEEKMTSKIETLMK